MMNLCSLIDKDHRMMTLGVAFSLLLATFACGSIIFASMELSEGGQSGTENVDVNIRLPTALKPVRYMMKLQPFIEGNFTINGYTEITFDVQETTRNVTLHINDISTLNDTIKITRSDDMNGPEVTIREFSYDFDTNFFVAKLEKELEVGEQYVISMEFISLVNNQLYGFYKSYYSDEDGIEKVLGVTQFEPTDARRAFPCFDEPTLKAQFEIFIARRTSMNSISNMPIIESEPFDDGSDWVWDHFDTTLPMSTYLVAFAVSDFFNLNSTANEHVLFRAWARQSAIEQVEYARDAAPAILTRYEQYFNIPFPLPKQDLIAVPDLSARAMENWGLITFLETFLLFDPVVCSELDKERTLTTIAHELAHQWFGDLVTMEWWTDLWLNEGFAAYVMYIGTDSVSYVIGQGSEWDISIPCLSKYEPSWGYLDELVLNDLQVAMALDCLQSSHQISVPVNRPEEINQLFDTISYSKGASILRMLNHSLTEDSFRQGLTNYLTSHKLGNAAQDDLWYALTEQAHADDTLPSEMTVKIIMDTWTLQMGYPVLHITVNGNSSVTVTQERFLLATKANSNDTHDYRWWIPITYTTQNNQSFEDTTPITWMADSETSIIIDDSPEDGEWILFNLQQTGFYRVNYDINNWQMIIQQLVTNLTIIPRVGRSQILDDSLNLARGGRLPYQVALTLSSYISNDREYIPWQTALTNLGYIESMLTRTAAYGEMQEFMLSLLTPLYESVGFDDNSSDGHQEQLLRILALDWSCRFGMDDCVEKSVELFSKWKSQPDDETCDYQALLTSSIIAPNIRGSVYCTAIAVGNEQEWDFLWSRYLAANVAQEQDRILLALGCSQQVWILSRYLEMAFDPSSGVRPKDSGVVFGAVAANDVGVSLAWDYLRNNVHHITSYLQTFAVIGNMISAVSAEFNTEEQLLELVLFEELHGRQLGAATMAIGQSIERTMNNIVWMTDYYSDILEWLQEAGVGTSDSYLM